MICPICPHRCNIAPGGTGLCRARSNTGGVIRCNNYGRLTALALDPIEKKPLARFHPGSMILSAGSYGCNLHCPFCQNSDIAMVDASIATVYVSPQELINRALAAVPQGNIGVAFTYNEPLVGYEYVQDCSALAKERGLKAVLVTNGMICAEPLLDLLPLIDAMNIDLKGFTQAFYGFVGGDLETVKQTIDLASRRCHVEVTTLIVPGRNDSEPELDAEAAWLASLSPDIPLHISRFFPRHKLAHSAPTPVETVYRLRDVAARHLRYVYTGNC